MAKGSAAIPVTGVALDRSSTQPLHRQLYDWLREVILSGQLAGGRRLPATRTLANELGVSRNTVMSAFDQLLAEGYVEGKVGAGTYVSHVLPDEVLYVSSAPRAVNGASRAPRNISRRAQVMSALPPMANRFPELPCAFRPGLPALDEFPFDTWANLMSRRWRNATAGLLAPGDPAGYGPLREAVAAYLGAARAVRCRPEQVIITAGSQQALDLAARVLLDPGDSAWIEEPGYLGTRGAMLNAGVRLVPVPVDSEGLDVAAGISLAPDARLACVSPSCQFPLCMTMSLSRRLALLEWAAEAGAWVVEDDYNSEYRYANRPLAALQGIDTDGRVIYIGTFSKVLFPSMRLGYLVVPPDLVEAFIAMRSRIDMHPPTLEQVVLTDFISEGHFARHIRRMRALYAERQAILVEAAGQGLRGLLDVRAAEAGMHLIGRLPAGADDEAVSARARAHGVSAPPLSTLYVGQPKQPGLLLGYASVNAAEIRQGVRQLATALKGTR